MSPMSLLNLSGETLNAAHANGERQSPHGERGERNYAAWFAMAMVLVSAAAMLIDRMH